jgi:Flp pilus assembly protein TadD
VPVSKDPPRFGPGFWLERPMIRILPALGLFLVFSTGAWALPQAAAKYLAQAETFAKSGDDLAAVQAFQSAIIQAPVEPAPYAALGSFYADRKDSEQARKYWGLALEVEPGHVPALTGLALLDLSEGNRDAALQRHTRLKSACAAGCPEIAQVEKALNGSAPGLDTPAVPN